MEKRSGHAFISYVREDAYNVDRLQKVLESAGVAVWRDTADLWPGEDWRLKVNRAITDNALVFIACFSSRSAARTISYQNEELLLAVEQIRQRRPGVPWLIPVRFDDCTMPDLDLGGSRTLASIQRADLFGEHREVGITRLVSTVQRLLGQDQLDSPAETADSAPQGVSQGSALSWPAVAANLTGSDTPQATRSEYTFDTFVIGPNSQFARAAAVAVAEAPARAYNPLLIYGGAGLGKTHLLHAIDYYTQSLHKGMRIRFTSMEEFTNDFINSIRDGKYHSFRRRYRDVDMLLVDDIQFLANKEGTQEEFFHAFNTLRNAEKQIVMTSDRAPKRLIYIDDRLRHRFESGLIADIQPPELETRVAILKKKANREGLSAPTDVLECIASRITNNIYELISALIRVGAFATLNGQPIDLDLVEIVLRDVDIEAQHFEITSPMIIGQTASYFGLTVDDLFGTSRSRMLITARQIAMYLCMELTDLSFSEIGELFGGRHHTAVARADTKIRSLMAERRVIYSQVTELINRIKQQAGLNEF